jgi:hypothetical protein
MATAAVAHETIAFTVASLQSSWGLSTLTEVPAPQHGLILFEIHPSGEETVKLFGRHLETEPEDEPRNNIRQYPLVAFNATSNPGPWLSQGVTDCLLSDERDELNLAEQGRYERLRVAQESFRGYRHDGLHTIHESGNTFNVGGDGFGLAADKTERFSWEPKPKKEAKKIRLTAGDKDTKIPASTPVFDWELDSAYLQWVSPSTVSDPRGKFKMKKAAK